MKMKKLMIFLGLILMSATMFAQTTKTCVSKVLRPGVSYYEYTGTSSDTLGVDRDSLYFEVLTNKSVPVACAARIEITMGTSDAENYEYYLQGKIFENEDWNAVSIDSSIAATGDVTLYTQNVSLNDTSGGSAVTVLNDQFYRYFRVLLATDGAFTATDTLNVDAVIFKFYER